MVQLSRHLLVVVAFAGCSGSSPPSAPRSPLRSADARLFRSRTPVQPGTVQLAAVQGLRRQLGALTARFSASGATRALSNPTGYLAATTGGLNAEDNARRFVRDHLDLLGLLAGDLDGWEVTDSVYSVPTGATHIYLGQRHRGLPVYNAQLQVHLSRDGHIIAVNNDFVPDIASAVRSVDERLGAAAAVRRAVESLGRSLKPIAPSRVLVPVAPGDVRLAWRFQIHTVDGAHVYDLTVDAQSGKVWTRVDWVAADAYHIYSRPTESPSHGPRDYLLNPANQYASPFGWQDIDGLPGPEYTGLNGNNVHAYEDRDADNLPPASEPDCGSAIDCDFPIDLTLEPVESLKAATTNLFYWNNLVHDIQYRFGFNEAAGNFQINNYERGGVGGDPVQAEAQDGGGTMNANFFTPPDGYPPRMQMFLWPTATPARDSDLDNGIVVHEYGHGISNRLVGGPSNTSCLGNEQQAGEGWSDWFALVYTAKPGDTGSDHRGIGTYAFGQPPTGGGLRSQPYSNDPTVSTKTYADLRLIVEPHAVGEVWAQALWKVYWALVDAYGFSPNFDDPTGWQGNLRAMMFITEGLKNTACNPTFLDARDAIIQAAIDTGRPGDVCLLWSVFASVGMGLDAWTDGWNDSATNGFEVPVTCLCDPAPAADAGPDLVICPGESVFLGVPEIPGQTYSWSPGGATTAQLKTSPSATTTYTVTASNSCAPVSDSTVVYVEDPSNIGLHEDFESGAIGWTTSGFWHLVSDSRCAKAPPSPTSAMYYGLDASCTYDDSTKNHGALISPSIVGIDRDSTLTFSYFREVEDFFGDYDRTEVRISSDEGHTWTRIWSLNSSDPSASAWVSSGAISLAAFDGHPIRVRFDFDTVDWGFNAFVGWMIDDVEVTARSHCGF